MSEFAIGKFARLARGVGTDRPQRHYPDSNAAAGAQIVFFDISSEAMFAAITMGTREEVSELWTMISIGKFARGLSDFVPRPTRDRLMAGK